MYMVAALFSVCYIVKLVEELRRVLRLVLACCDSLWLLLLLLVVWGKDSTPGWSILRENSGEIFVNLKGRLEVNNVCLMPL